MQKQLSHRDEMIARKARRATWRLTQEPYDDSRYTAEALRAIRATSHNFRGELRR